jgi:hypothetical protein
MITHFKYDCHRIRALKRLRVFVSQSRHKCSFGQNRGQAICGFTGESGLFHRRMSSLFVRCELDEEGSAGLCGMMEGLFDVNFGS